MIAKLNLGLAIIGSTVVASIAAPAAAAIDFATLTAPTTARNLRIVNLGNSPSRTADAAIYTTSTAGGTVPGAAAMKFSFLVPALAPYVTNINALYTLTGTIAANTPATPAGSFFIQTGVSGSFSIVTTSAIAVAGPTFTPHVFAAGSVLLAGTFSGVNIVSNPGGLSGSLFSAGTVTYTSDFLDFTSAGPLTFTSSIGEANPVFSQHAGANGALNSLRGRTAGSFGADALPIPTFLAPVPEPRTWALMIVGFGMVGVMRRRRTARLA